MNIIRNRSGTRLILCALNLFMLGFLRNNLQFPGNTVLWCDGLMGLWFLKARGYSAKRLRGVEMLKLILAANRGRSVCILGSCSDFAKNALLQHGIEIAQHFSLESLNVETFNINSLSLNSTFVLVTLPSPLQELISFKLLANATFANTQIFCIGGALNMLAYPELDCPKSIQLLGLEFLFRMKTDTARRLNRFFRSLIDTVKNIRRLSEIEIIMINK